MRYLRNLLLPLVLSGVVPVVHAQSPVLPAVGDGSFVIVTAPNGCVTDGSGSPIADGTIQIQSVDGGGNAIPVGYGVGQAVTTPVTRMITAGSLAGSLQLVNPAVSSPSQVLYHITVIDNSTHKGTNYKGVPLYLNDVPVSGRNTVFNFCKMNTGLAVPSVPTAIIQGPQGPPGINGSVTPLQLQSSAAGAVAAASLAQGAPQANLFDVATVTTGAGLTPSGATLTYAGVFYTGYMVVAGQASVVSSGDVIGNSTFASIFYDANENVLSTTGSAVIPAGAPITIPTGAVYARFTYVSGSISGFTQTSPASLVVFPGSTLPSTYVQTARAIAQAQASTLVQLTPLAGKKFMVFGDSISDLGALDGPSGVHWESLASVITGVVPGINRAQAGRRTFQAFTEYLSADAGTVNTARLASDLATQDEAVIFLGTNDTLELAQGHIVVGSITDSPGGCNRTQGSSVSGPGLGPYAYSFYAYAQCVVDTIQQAAPTKKLVIVGQYHRQVPAGQPIPSGDYTGYGTDVQIDALNSALQTIAASRGIFFVDLAKTSGIGLNTIANPDGSALFLRDHLHPSDALGFPAIAKQIARGMVDAY